jgi:TetR/AcrR family transcriptional regulator, cholesterol catabolism regulator
MTADIQSPSVHRLPISGTVVQRKLADAAIELFYARGAMATSVREITAACGLTPGALYNHFASKDHLVYVLVRDIHLQVNAMMAAARNDAGDDPADQLWAVVTVLTGHTAGSKKQSRVANREYTTLTGERRAEVRALRRELRDLLARVLLHGAELGEFGLVGSDDFAAATLTAGAIAKMCVHISQHTLETFQLGIPDLQDRYAQMALRIAGAARTGPARR